MFKNTCKLQMRAAGRLCHGRGTRSRMMKFLGCMTSLVRGSRAKGQASLAAVALAAVAASLLADWLGAASLARAADPPVVGRIESDRLLLDPRTLADDEIDLVAAALGRTAAG